jgi:hypothetical protein
MFLMKVRCTLIRVCLLGAVLMPVVAKAQFFFTANNGAVTIIGYSGSERAVTIPNEINGLPVVNIADGAFSYLYSLTNLV